MFQKQVNFSCLTGNEQKMPIFLTFEHVALPLMFSCFPHKMLKENSSINEHFCTSKKNQGFSRNFCLVSGPLTVQKTEIFFPAPVNLEVGGPSDPLTLCPPPQLPPSGPEFWTRGDQRDHLPLCQTLWGSSPPPLRQGATPPQDFSHVRFPSVLFSGYFQSHPPFV